MDTEAKRIKEQNKNMPFKERLSNFWTYYKAHTFVAIACIIVFGTSVVQCATQIKYDLTVSMYSSGYISEEFVTEIEEILKEQCTDVTGDEAVNVNISTNVGDITGDKMDEMLQGVLMKLQAELAASASGAFVVDEAYKTLLVESYEYPAEDVIELTGIPQINERLKLSGDIRLYWLPSFERKQTDKPDQFDNVRLVKQYFEENVE